MAAFLSREGPGGEGATATSLDEETERILLSAGIDSAPMDPLSMAALRELVAERRLQRHHRPAAGTLRPGQQPPVAAASSDGGGDSKPAAIPAAAIPTWTSTGTGGGILKKPPPHEWSASAASRPSLAFARGGGGTSAAATAATLPAGLEASLMEQLTFQTSLLLDLQRKMQILTDKVERLEGRNGVGSGSRGGSPFAASSPPSGAAPFFSGAPFFPGAAPSPTGSAAHPTSPRTAVHPDNSHSAPQEDAHQRGVTLHPPAPDGGARMPADDAAANAAGILPGGLGGVVANHPVLAVVGFPVLFVYRAVRFEVQVWRTLYRMARRDIPRLEGGMFFQLIFVLLVLSSRISPNTAPRKFGAAVAVVVVGFLYQAKALPFLYRFFVKNNVPRRIWRGLDPEGGEDDDNGNGPGRNGAGLRRGGGGGGGMGRIGGGPPGGPEGAAAAAADPNAAVDGWRHAFFMGGIAPRGGGRQMQQQRPHQDQRDGGIVHSVVGIVWDVVYLFGSFVLSIFPMWRPEAQPLQPGPVEEGVAGVPGFEGGRVEDGPQHPPGQQPPPPRQRDPEGNGGIQLPHVQPPRDAMEPADDGDEDDEDDDEDIYA